MFPKESVSMKEFIKTQKVTYNLMSFTAFKALIMFSELVDGPKSYQEICDIFYNHPYLREQISIDTFRVYINSLKRFGCEVKRIKGDDKVSKYMVAAHPFELNYSPAQLKSILKVFKSLVKNIDIDDLIAMSEFFEKIGSYIKNEDFVNEVKKISLMKNINKDILKTLSECCKKKQQIIIKYASPKSGEKLMEILTDKLEISNGKIYLYGIGFEYKQYGSFLVSRIKTICDIKDEHVMPDGLTEIKVIYELYNTKNPEQESYEKIIEQTPDKTIIEAVTTNPFILKQKLLSLGPNCKVIAPDEFKNELVTLLKDMKAGYYSD